MKKATGSAITRSITVTAIAAPIVRTATSLYTGVSTMVRKLSSDGSVTISVATPTVSLWYSDVTSSATSAPT